MGVHLTAPLAFDGYLVAMQTVVTSLLVRAKDPRPGSYQVLARIKA